LPYETPLSNAGRNAALNHQTNGVSAFCTDLGLSFSGLHDGEDQAIAKLAALLGVEHAAFDLGTIGRQGHSFYLRGQRLLQSSLRRRRLHVCPACISRDITVSDLPPLASAYCRSHWLLDAIRVCPEHRLELVALELRSDVSEYDFSARLAPYLEADVLPRKHFDAPLRFQSYLFERLEKPPSTGNFLDELEFHVAARLCEILGVTMMFGKKQTLETLSNSDWLAAGELGFSYASEPNGYRSALTELQRNFDLVATSKDGVAAVFGHLHRWLSIGRPDPSFKPVRDLTRVHIVQSMPIGAGEVLFGEAVTVRKIHSVRSASVELQAQPQRLRRLLRAHGCLAPADDGKPDALTLFDAQRHAGFLCDIREAIHRPRVGRYIGASGQMVSCLIREGLIKPFVRASAEHQLQQNLFLPRDLDGFLERLFEHAILSKKATEEPLVDVMTAAHRANTPLWKVLEWILSGRLKPRRGPGPLKVTALLINLPELRTLARSEYDLITRVDVCKTLKVSKDDARRLVKAGLLKIEWENDRSNRRHKHLVCKSDLERFYRKYCSLNEVAQYANVSCAHAEYILTSNGLRPAIPRDRGLHPFYFRSVLGSGPIALAHARKDSEWNDVEFLDAHFLNATQIARIAPFFPKRYQRADWRAVSGIVHIMRQGLRWSYANEYGGIGLYSRFVTGSRRGVFDRVFHALAQEDLGPDRILVSIEHLNAQPTAAKLVEAGFFPLLSREALRQT
jgi:transposase